MFRRESTLLSATAAIKILLFSVLALVLSGGIAAASIKNDPTFKDVPYGAHPRAVLDFWKANTENPAPVVIFIHGGGFYLGDKSHVSEADIKQCLENGVSFASISYPYYQDMPLHEIIRDNIARSVQFIRHKSADWNIDKSRVVVYGQSAGAGSSLWIASHDDLADPSSQDPVLRESSRVTAAGLIATQATYHFPLWKKLFENSVDPKTVKAWMMILDQTMLDMYHAKNAKQLKSKEFEPMLRDLDMLSLMDANDPPLIMTTFTSKLPGGDILHHERHPQAVKEKCDAVGMKCVINLDSTPDEKRVGTLDFLLEQLSPDSTLK
ncbi:MAG TPA: alpha/beta hydrolase [bacterium]|nr:alpha/beta hydrolase [bacterium]